jgi:hypothetical protein
LRRPGPFDPRTGLGILACPARSARTRLNRGPYKCGKPRAALSRSPARVGEGPGQPGHAQAGWGQLGGRRPRMTDSRSSTPRPRSRAYRSPCGCRATAAETGEAGTAVGGVSCPARRPKLLPALMNVVQGPRSELIEATRVCVGTRAHGLGARAGWPKRERSGGARQGTRGGR